MKSAIALLAALVGLSGLVALSCTAPLAGAPCPCLDGFEECDLVTQTCRTIQGDAAPIDGSSFAPADAAPEHDAASGPSDGGLDPFDAAGWNDADPFQPDADAWADAGGADAA